MVTGPRAIAAAVLRPPAIRTSPSSTCGVLTDQQVACARTLLIDPPLTCRHARFRPVPGGSGAAAPPDDAGGLDIGGGPGQVAVRRRLLLEPGVVLGHRRDQGAALPGEPAA